MNESSASLKPLAAERSPGGSRPPGNGVILKENAEYHAAKEEQARLETRIAKLREQIRSAAVLEAPASSARVQHGSTVSYTDRSTNRQHTFRIVAPHEARLSDGALSSASPVARALIGRGIGDGD